MRPATALILALAALALLGPGRLGPARAQVPASWVDQVFPDRQHDFGTVARGSKLRHAFPVVNTSNTDVRILSYQTKCGCTDVRLGAKVIPPGTQTTVEATLDTTQFQEYKASGLTLTVEGPSRSTVELALTCFIQTTINLNPGLVDFGTVVAGTAEPQAVLNLTYTGPLADWRIVRSKHSSPAMTARIEEIGRTAGGAVQFRIVATLDPRRWRAAGSRTRSPCTPATRRRRRSAGGLGGRPVRP